jgi:hypothetical protein
MIKQLTVLCSALLLVACGSLTACWWGSEQISEADRGELSSRMVELSRVVDTYFSTLSVPPTENDQEIISKAVENTTGSVDPMFNNYQLHVQYQQHFAVLLLCDKDNKHALMEDAGCSAGIDRQIRKPADCKFTLQVTKGCLVEGGDL